MGSKSNHLDDDKMLYGRFLPFFYQKHKSVDPLDTAKYIAT